MPLSTGDRLGPYEILASIGVGGMGEVYRARDSRLGREVAIKVSHEKFTERFEQEARSIAALNHPNICHLYDVGPNYLVMELVDGAPLKGPLPLEKAVDYAGQILEALDAAHQKGITHRDLKPDNILVAKQGIKLLDFGLAKQAVRLSEDDATKALTDHGQIVGTLQYMSPEQLQGKGADARSDLFSFGCVLYELLSGRRAFSGTSAASLIAAILEREPVPLDVSAPLDRVIRSCLAKEPGQRFHSAVDLKRALEWAVEPTTRPAVAPRRSLRFIAAFALVGLLIAAAASYLTRTLAPKPEMTRLDFAAPDGMPLVQSALAISPDGRTVAFAAGTGERKMIWLRPLVAGVARALPGTEGGISPFWSPDATYIGFIVPGSDHSQIKKIAVGGGPPQILAEVSNYGAWASWGREGVILVMQSNRGALYRVPASGGPANEGTILDNSRGEMSHRWPHFLPDGRHFLFLVLSRDPANTGIFAGALDSNERTRLSDVRSNAAYASGYLLYVRERVLLAQPFDARKRRLNGEPMPVFENIEYFPGPSRGAFSTSEGNLVARASKLSQLRQLTWLDRSGKTLKTAGDPGDLIGQRLSPDGNKVAVSSGDRQGGLRELRILDLERGVLSPLSKGLVGPATLVFSPDAARIAFSRGNKSYAVSVSSGVETQLADNATATDWSHDGQYVALTGSGTSTILPLASSRKSFHSPEQGGSVRFSRDGRWIAYVVGPDNARQEVYVEPFSGTSSKGAGRIQVSPAGGREPQWSSDGNELFYISGDNRLMATPVRLRPPFSVGIPKALFEIPAGVTYDVAADGKQFLLNLPVGDTSPDSPVTVLLNWPSALPH